MSLLFDKMNEARREAHASEVLWNLKMEEHKKEHADQKLMAQSSFLSACKPAKKKHYAAWLEGYVEDGGTIGHAYPYGWPGGLIAKRDCTITPLYGASSVTVIVPKGINVEIEELGHNTVYFMEDFSVGGGFVPVYSDM